MDSKENIKLEGDTAVHSTDLLAPERCEKCGYLGHSAPECEYPFPQGYGAQQRRDRDWSLLGGQVVGAETWANYYWLGKFSQ